MERDIYAAGFRRARMDAASRLIRPDFEERDGAAREIGISASMLAAIETAKKRPSFETLELMAKAYNVLPGDLLPSMAPKGAEVDRILGPLMSLPERARSRFITQMETFARMLAAEVAAAALPTLDEDLPSRISVAEPHGHTYTHPSSNGGGREQPRGDIAGTVAAVGPATRFAHVQSSSSGRESPATATRQPKKESKRR